MNRKRPPKRFWLCIPLLAGALQTTAYSSAWAGWIQDGTAICAETGNQESPVVVSDGAGGAFVAWADYRDGNYDIYAQRVSASGTILWTRGGLPVCTATGNQASPKLDVDGSGGVLLAWRDSRNGYLDIYAQRLSGSGAILWSTDGVPVCTAIGDQHSQWIVQDGTGGAIITWEDNRSGSYDIYARRLDASGVPLWNADGNLIATSSWWQRFPRLVSDGAAGAIITWQDQRSGHNDIYAQRVDASGDTLWTGNGQYVCVVAAEQLYPTIASDGAGGAIITWEDYRDGNSDVYAQRVSPSGLLQWIPATKVCKAVDGQVVPRIVSDGAGGAIIAWHDMRSGTSFDVYVQRVDASGDTLWTKDGVPVCVETGDQLYPKVVSDGTGGGIFFWKDLRSVDFDLYTQRVGASGNAMWEVNGLAVCAAIGDQSGTVITSDGAGGALVAWQDSRASDWDIYFQSITRHGCVGCNSVPMGHRSLILLSIVLIAGGLWALARRRASPRLW